MRRLKMLLLILFGFLFCFNASSFAQSAMFQGTDTTTQGNFQGTYGGDGFFIPNYPPTAPGYAAGFTVQNQFDYTWAQGTSDPRALKTSSGGIATCWCSASTFTIDVPITDGATHFMALYALDWDDYEGGRSEKIQIENATTSAVLDTETVSSFTNGVYLTWNVSGNIKIVVTNENSASNAVVSGVFFGQNSSMLPPVTSGAYQNITETVVGGGPYQQVNLLNVPAGTYLIHFSVSDAANITATQPVEGIGCILQPTNLIYSISAEAVPYKGDAGMSISAIDHLVTLVPTSIAAACDSMNSDKLQIESELEAIPVTSINVQTGGNTGFPLSTGKE